MARIRKSDLRQMPIGNHASIYSCTIYVVSERESAWVKLGIAGHPARRLSMLQCGNPRKLEFVALYDGTPSACKEIEGHALRYFGRQPGSEWVIASDPEDVVRYLDSFCEEQPA